MFTKKVLIGSNDIDQNLTVRIASLMRIIQDTIMDHTEEIHVGKQDTIDKGIIWVVTRLRLDIERLPKYQEEILIKTYPGATKSFFYQRFLSIEDMSGNTIVKLSSIWTLLDAKTRMITLNQEIASRCLEEHHDGELPLPEKIDIKHELGIKDERRVRYHDVDLNGHLNFTKYIEFILDLYSSDFYRKNPIKSIILNYAKEIKEDQIVKVLASDTNPDELKIVSDLGDHLFAKIEY